MLVSESRGSRGSVPNMNSGRLCRPCLLSVQRTRCPLGCLKRSSTGIFPIFCCSSLTAPRSWSTSHRKEQDSSITAHYMRPASWETWSWRSCWSGWATETLFTHTFLFQCNHKWATLNTWFWNVLSLSAFDNYQFLIMWSQSSPITSYITVWNENPSLTCWI